jgi:hypothetical protein
LNKIGLFDFLVQNIDDTLLYETSRDPDEHVRWVMYISSFKIATTYFPFGSGLATFGSLLSVIFYSPLYYEYGINLIGMNSEADVQNGAHTLLDTFWPHVIAESGYLGTVIYITLFFFPLQLSRKYLDTRLKFLTVSVLLVIFIEGFFLYTPEIPIFILLYSGFLSLVIFSKIKSN